MAARSKAWVCGSLFAGISVSNLAWGDFVCYECCVVSGKGFSDKLITRPEESYRIRCVVLCDLETSRIRRPWPASGRSTTGGGCIFLKIKVNMKSLPSTKAYGGVEFVGASSDTRSRIEFVFIATELKIPSLGYERSTDS